MATETDKYVFAESKPISYNIAFDAATGTTMLAISETGFYVRGVKVEQGPDEARQVYEAFKEWLVWSSLNRQY